jgi:hypothetical protein
VADSAYPKDRPKFFAHRYCRLLTKTCAAQDIGHIAFVLCVTIAHQEDAKRYKGAVTFFNGQLMPLVGVTKWDVLDRARNHAVAGGWLRYIPGNHGQRQPGRYWVTIPSGLDDLADAACDETQYPRKGEREESQYPRKGYREGAREGAHEREHSTLFPNPIPKDSGRKRPVFVKPSLEDVQAFFSQESLNGDPAEFFDHYEANGWKQSGGLPIKKWKAAARQWSRRQPQFAGRNGSSKAPSEAAQPSHLQYRD